MRWEYIQNMDMACCRQEAGRDRGEAGGCRVQAEGNRGELLFLTSILLQWKDSSWELFHALNVMKNFHLSSAMLGDLQKGNHYLSLHCVLGERSVPSVPLLSTLFVC